MATLTEIPEMANTQTFSHDYHAEAHVLSGHLQRPIEQKIEQHAPVSLHDRRGGHFTRFTETVSIEGLVTFSKGKTRVSGSRSLKHNGWVTLSTSILEGLNIFEVVTADRIVSQISTDHPYENGHVPQVTFLGTQFSNLRVSGFPVELKLNFGICGSKPADDRSYLQDASFLKAVKKQNEELAHAKGLPKQLKERYEKRLEEVERLIRTSDSSEPLAGEPSVVCSLVEGIGEIPLPGATSYGNVLVLPEFGSVAFGEVIVGQKRYQDTDKPSIYFELSCVKADMGCLAHGSVSGATTTVNGMTRP